MLVSLISSAFLEWFALRHGSGDRKKMKTVCCGDMAGLQRRLSEIWMVYPSEV